MTKQNVEAVDDDGDDVVIIGDVMPKPMIAHEKNKRRRRVEFKKCQYKKESLVITQKVKVKKQKYRCILKKAKASDILSNQDSVKKDNKCVNGSLEAKEKCERYVPVCMRKICKDGRRKVEPKPRKTNEGGRRNRSHHFDFPRDLKRMLSPVSPSPLEGDLSFDLEISLDTSSLQEMKESKLDTLIKRTRDRERKYQMTRTQYLFTPPHQHDNTEDVKLPDINDNPPCTSTPKYEENDDKKSSITSNNNTMEQSKTDNSLVDIHLILSPIKKADDILISKSINFKEQGSQCFSSIIKNINIHTKSKSVNIATSDTNCKQIITDTTVDISNNIKEQGSKGNLFCQEMEKTQNETSELCQTNISNIINEKSIFSNKILVSNNTKQSIKDQAPILEDKEVQTVVPNNHDKNIAEKMSISYNNYVDQKNNTISSSLEKTQVVHKKSEYTQTVNFDTNYEEIHADTRILVSHNIVEPTNKSSHSVQSQTKNETCDIQTIVTNTNELLIDDRKIPDPFYKDIKNKKSEYIQTVSLQNIDYPNKQNNNYALATIKHTVFDDIQAQNKQIPNMQTIISEKNISDNRMSISYTNNNVEEQVCTPNSPLNLQNRKIHDQTNMFDSNTNYEQNIEPIDMSISYDNDDNVVDQPFAQSLTYEDAHLQHRQSEYYQYNAIKYTDHGNNNDEDNHSDNFHTNYKQIAENSQMSIFYNNYIDQHNIYNNLFVDDKHLQQKTFVVSYSNNEQNNNFIQELHRVSDPFDEDIHVQDKKYDSHTDLSYADYNYYKPTIDDRKKPSYFNNYTEQCNKSQSPFFEDSHVHKQFDINYSYSKQEQKQCRKMTICNDTDFKEQQNIPFFEEHKKSVTRFVEYSNKKYEQIRKGYNPNSYNNTFKEQQNTRHSPYFGKRQHNNTDYYYSAPFNKQREQIENMSVSYYNNNSDDHQNTSQSWFSNNFHEQPLISYYIHTPEQKNNRNCKPSRLRNTIFDRVQLQQKIYKHMHTDDPRKTHGQNIDDRDTSVSYENENFKEKTPKHHSSFPYDSQYKKYKCTNNHDNSYYEKRVEERKVSIKNNTYSEVKRTRGRVEDRHHYFQHKKSLYNAVSKKKVEIFIDKRMSDEAYEDVLIGLPPDRVSPDLP